MRTRITDRKHDQLVDALNTLVGQVTSEFTAAVANSWEARTRESVATRKLEADLNGPNRTIKKFIRSYLQLRPGESVTISGRQWYVNYARSDHGGKEVFRPHLSFLVYISPGIKIDVDVSPHQSASHTRMIEVLIRTLDRVQRMVEAARK